MNYRLLKKLQERPEVFFKKILGCDSMEEYHLSILRDVSRFNRVAIAACHALGKTWIMARVVLWFLFCYKNSVVITTAPTNRQVEELLWGEIHVAVKNALINLGGHLTKKKLEIAGKWYALGFSPAKTAGGSDSKEQQGSTFQGFHADYILIVFDEAVGVPPDIWTQVEGLLTSGTVVKFVCIANPTTKNCNFFDCFKKSTWRKIFLSCFDSPNLTANGFYTVEDIKKEVDILLSMPEEERLVRIEQYKKPVGHLISAQWVIEKAMPDEWGVDHPLFLSKVLGQFPEVDDSTLIQEADVKKSQARKGYTKEKGKRLIGVDVARFGDDLSCFTELIEADKNDHGTEYVHARTLTSKKRDLMDLTGKLVKFINEEDDGGEVIVLIDCTGLGSGVYDRLVEIKGEGDILPKRIRIVEIHFGGAVTALRKDKKNPTKKELENEKTYSNIKAIMFDDLKKALRKDLRILNQGVYNLELVSIKYKFTSSGKMKIESKEDYKKRTGKGSPDRSDSLALANLGRRFTGYGDYLRKLVK